MNGLKIDDLVEIKTYGRTIGTGQIVDIGGNDLNSKSCYWVRSNDEENNSLIMKFYVKPELGTRKHLNVGNNAFWIEVTEE